MDAQIEMKDLQQQIALLKIENEKLRKQIQAQEQKNCESPEEQFKNNYASKIFASLPDMVTIFTYGGIFKHLISSEESNHVGMPSEAIINKHLSEFLSPETARIIYDSIQKVKYRKQPYTGHHTIKLNEMVNHYEHRILPLDENYVIIYCRDVTNQVQQTKRNRDLKDLLDNILNNLPIYLFVKDAQNDMKYIYWNRTFAEASGIPTSMAIGRTDFEIFPNITDANKFRRDDNELMAHRTPIAYEEEYTNVNGETIFLNTKKVICKLSENKDVLIGVSIDISEAKKMEKELMEAKLRAEKNDKQKSIFLSNMGHEIRTPVNAIVGFTEILPCAETPEEQKQYMEVIRQNSNLLLQLIDDILDISKIEAGTLEFIYNKIDLGSVCSNIYEMHKNTAAKKGIQFVYENLGESFPMVSDVNRIMQVINNFLTNAFKFTSKGEIRFGFHRIGNDKIYFHVTDTGMGISKNNQLHLFDRFVKLHPEINGTGLGLFICKTIVEKFGGEIGVNSTEKKGSCFYFIIPTAAPKEN